MGSINELLMTDIYTVDTSNLLGHEPDASLWHRFLGQFRPLVLASDDAC